MNITNLYPDPASHKEEIDCKAYSYLVRNVCDVIRNICVSMRNANLSLYYAQNNFLLPTKMSPIGNTVVGNTKIKVGIT
jgi:hypothetical protein